MTDAERFQWLEKWTARIRAEKKPASFESGWAKYWKLQPVRVETMVVVNVQFQVYDIAHQIQGSGATLAEAIDACEEKIKHMAKQAVEILQEA